MKYFSLQKLIDAIKQLQIVKNQKTIKVKIEGLEMDVSVENEWTVINGHSLSTREEKAFDEYVQELGIEVSGV